MIDRAQRNVALLVAGCFFMEILDGTIVTTSAPRIAHSLGVSVADIALVITAYLVTVAVLIPLSGWIAARYGGRAAFLIAIVLFTLASAGCAASTSFPELIVARVAQGAGGAMMVPVGRLLVITRANPSNLMRLTALLIWPGLVAPVVAPLAGGLITTYASWHWLFLINLPLGVLAFAVAWRLIHPPALPHPGALDVTGLVLIGVGLGGLTFTAALLARTHTDWSLVGAIAVPSAVFMALAPWHLMRAGTPLIDLRLKRIHTFRSAFVGSALHFTALNAVPFLVPLLFEEVFGWSAVRSGLVVLFVFLGNLVAKPSTGYLYSRFGFRKVILAATLGMGTTMIVVGAVGTSTPVAVLALILLLSGAARSIGATGYSTVIFSDVPPAEMRHANTLFMILSQLAASFGVAGGAIALRLGHPIGSLLSGRADTHVTYTVALIMMACVEFLATAEALRMHPGSGDALRGDRAPVAAERADRIEPDPAVT